MITHGANVEQLTTLGRTLTKQIDAINQMMSTVDGVLNGTAWTGPARDRFVEDWNGSFKQALNRLNEAFDAAGRSCVSRSDELRHLMEV
jgi:uncharacterized protein YukE